MNGEVLQEFDLQPDPRILPMLGEITLPQWRCLAEFIDNSVDSLLSALRTGTPIIGPEIHVSVPTSDSRGVKITVVDNGPGMGPPKLERAVRAGWTGNDPIQYLGMFGMGFNIATARLGSLTRVWTTRAGDREWCGVEIDFDRLMEQRHFRTPRLTRPKVDSQEHGTEISVERLKPEQREWFAKAANRAKLKKEFGRVYSAMLRSNGVPISFSLILNGTRISGRNHCIWGAEGDPQRQVKTARYGMIDALQHLDTRLADRQFCTKCWQWLPHSETVCPACLTKDQVITRHRRVSGWLGVQRYISQTEYGIDFLRNGRKIEMGNKDLFLWDGGGTVELEYPIDDPRNRGRIVGEIHLDHCRVTYTKDRFDRNDPAWEEMVRIVRGDGPLRPDRASELGFGQNTAPLFLIFQAFRRHTPHSKTAGVYERLLAVKDNARAEEMAKRFYAGEAEYQSDAKWWDLIQEADRELLKPKGPEAAGERGLAGFTEDEDTDEGTGSAEPETPQQTMTPPPPRVALPSLTREFQDPMSGQRWSVAAFEVKETDPALPNRDIPWVLTARSSGGHEFFVNVGHPVFRSATLVPLDALLAELAWSAMDFARGHQSGTLSFAGVLASLRGAYAVPSSLDPTTLASEAGLTLRAIAGSLSEHLSSEDSRELFAELTPGDREAIQQKMAARSVPSPQHSIDDGSFLQYAPPNTLLRFFETHPELFFDGRYWDVPYRDIEYEQLSATETARQQVFRHYVDLISDVVWLHEQDPLDLESTSRSRLLRAALALDLLAMDLASDQ